MTCKPRCPAGNSQLPGRSIGPDDWAAVLKDTKQFKTLGAALPKNEPPRGDKEGYLKLANASYQNAKATDEAADNKDKIKAAAAFAKLSTRARPVTGHINRTESGKFPGPAGQGNLAADPWALLALS